MKKLLRISLIICLVSLMLVSCGKKQDKEENEYGNLSYFVNPDGNTCTVTGIGNFEESKLVIDEIDGYKVTVIQSRAFFGCEQIKSVVIGDSVTDIGELAFGNCINLESVKLTCSMKSIGSSVFYGCSSLVSVEFPSQLEEIGDAAFANCVGLVEMSIPDGVKRIGKLAFSNCASLKKVTVPKSANEIDWYAFDGCTALEGVYISDISAWCDIDFSTDTTNPLYYAKKLYLNNKLVRELTFSSQINKNVNKIGNRAFINCKDIAAVIAGNSNIKSIGAYAFAGTGVSDVTLFDSVEFIGVGAFDNCKSLSRIVYDGTMEQWESIYYGGEIDAEVICSDDSVVPGGNNEIYSEGLEYEINKGDGETCTVTGIGSCKDTKIVIGEYIDGYKVVKIGNNAFEGCENIIHITLPDSIERIGTRAFYGCVSLEYIKIPDNIETIYTETFGKCKSLKSIGLPLNLNDISAYAFYGCVSLESVEIPDKVTMIGDCAFEQCLSLESVYIPKSVVSIYWGAFVSCNNLDIIKYEGTRNDWNKISNGDLCFGGDTCDNATLACSDGEFKIDENGNIIVDTPPVIDGSSWGLAYEVNADGLSCTITGIGECKDKEIVIGDYIDGYKVTAIGAFAFSECGTITHVTVPDSVADIGSAAFQMCTSLESIELPDSIEYLDGAFYGCASLTSIELPQSLQTIGYYTFYECTSLKLINIPKNVSAIDEKAFSGCTSLELITYSGTSEEWNVIRKEKNCFGDGTFGNAVLVCNSEKYYLSYNGDIRGPVEVDGSQKLEYTLFTDELTYGVSGIGECTDTYLRISSKHGDMDVTKICEEAFYDNHNITGVELEEGIVAVDKNAFNNCYNIKEIIIPSSVNSIGESAFRGCAMETLTIPGACAISQHAFSSCTYLTSADIRYVSNIPGMAFTGCYNLISIELGASLESIEAMAFFGCDELQTVYFDGTIDEWIAIEKGLYCFQASSTDRPQIALICSDGDYIMDEEGAVIGKAESQFEGCSTGLRYYANRDGKSCTVTGIGTCMDDVIVIGGSIDGFKVTAIAEKAFYQCSGFSKVIIGEGVTSIGRSAFEKCQDLAYVEMADSVSEIGTFAFFNCASLSEVRLSEGIGSIPSYAFGRCENLKSINIPNGVESVNTNAFGTCSSLVYVYIPESLTDMEDSAFARCENLHTVEYGGTMDQWDAITKMGNFNGEVSFTAQCSDGVIISSGYFWYQTSQSGGLAVSGLGEYPEIGKNIEIPSEYNGQIIDEIRPYAFEGYSSVESVIIPDAVVIIGEGAFADCAELQRVELKGASCYLGDDLFYESPRVSTVYFHGAKQEWYSMEKAEDWLHNRMLIVYCIDGEVLYGADGIDITDSVNSQRELTYDVIDGETVISGIQNQIVSDVVIYGGIVENDGDVLTVTNIADRAFENNTQIKTLIIGSNIEEIGDNAFAGCTNLETLVLMSSDVKIEIEAFMNCESLQRIVYYGTIADWNSMSRGVRWRNGTNYFVVECINGEVEFNVPK